MHADQPGAEGVAVRRDRQAGVVVRLLRRGEGAQWREWMAAEHHRGDVPPVGNRLRYVATLDVGWVTLLAGEPTAWLCRPRERRPGWALALRRRRCLWVKPNERCVALLTPKPTLERLERQINIALWRKGKAFPPPG